MILTHVIFVDELCMLGVDTELGPFKEWKRECKKWRGAHNGAHLIQDV